MADIRTMKLNLLADVSQFGQSLNKADKDTQTLSGKIGKYSKQMAKAFAVAGAAAGAYAIKIGIEGVKAAVEDEASQVQLAKALQNTTNATDKQIASTEEWITKQQLSYGISDLKLRPALANLARATGDVEKAQKLTNLAMDISAATGKDLETVSLTLGKAYNGNIGSLTKLGIPLDDNIKKSGDFLLVQDELTKLFGGAAQANTKTYAGQLAIVTERFDEMKESIGVKILPIMKSLLEQVNLVAMGFSGEDQQQGLSGKVKALSRDLDGKSGGYSLGESLRQVADAFTLMFKALVSPDAKDGESTLESMANSLESFANGLNNVTNAYKNYKKWYDSAPKGLRDFMNPFSRLGDYAGLITGGNATKGGAAGGMVRAGQAITVGEYGKETFIPTSGGQIIPKGQLGGSGNTFILNGIVDAESARRSIEKLMQDSSRRTGAVNFVGATL